MFSFPFTLGTFHTSDLLYEDKLHLILAVIFGHEIEWTKAHGAERYDEISPIPYP